MAVEEGFSIRQMIDLTGLSEFTLRGWESRYHVFSPKRTETGRRQYNKQDVEKALLLRELLKRGHRIGKIAALPPAELRALFEQSPRDIVHSAPQRPEVDAALKFTALQNWRELNELFLRIRAPTPSALVSDFFLPLIVNLNEQISRGLVSISQEHIVSSFLKERIYAELSRLSQKGGTKKGKTRFVLATPEGDYHEIGLLIAHLLLRAQGITSLYLGPSTPARELAETALRFDATHVLIAATVGKKAGARQEFLSYLHQLTTSLREETCIFVAGPKTEQLRNGAAPRVEALANFAALESEIRSLSPRGGAHP